MYSFYLFDLINRSLYHVCGPGIWAVTKNSIIFKLSTPAKVTNLFAQKEWLNLLPGKHMERYASSLLTLRYIYTCIYPQIYQHCVGYLIHVPKWKSCPHVRFIPNTEGQNWKQNTTKIWCITQSHIKLANKAYKKSSGKGKINNIHVFCDYSNQGFCCWGQRSYPDRYGQRRQHANARWSEQ